MEYQLAAIVQLRKRIEELENQVEELTIKLEKEKQENLTNHKYGNKHLS
jgi:transcriptional antiterminator Rof (Rho-off)